MKCPQCNKDMKKVGWQITNNQKSGNDFKEYDKNTYQCGDDDIWITTEIPTSNSESTA